VQPVDRAARDIFGHAAYAVIESPAVVAIQITFPFGEEIGDDRVEVARQNAGADVREQPSAHDPIDVTWRPVAVGGRDMRARVIQVDLAIGQQIRVLGELGFRKRLWLEGRGQRALRGRLH